MPNDNVPKTISLKTTDGDIVEFVNEIKASGGMKDVYFSPKRDYVVAFFRDKPDAALRDRIGVITGNYRDRIFNQAGGEYWKSVYRWPTGMVEHLSLIHI